MQSCSRQCHSTNTNTKKMVFHKVMLHLMTVISGSHCQVWSRPHISQSSPFADSECHIASMATTRISHCLFVCPLPLTVLSAIILAVSSLFSQHPSLFPFPQLSADIINETVLWYSCAFSSNCPFTMHCLHCAHLRHHHHH